MNRKRYAQVGLGLLGVALLVALSGALFLPQRADAFHFVFGQQKHYDSAHEPFPRNMVIVPWWLNLDVEWHSDPGIRPNVVEVINKWTAAGAIPELSWVEVTDPAQADVTFLENGSLCAVEHIAPGATEAVSFFGDSQRQAAYIEAYEVCINTQDFTYGPMALTGTVAHEIGHVYGLDEAYNDVDSVIHEGQEVDVPFCRAEKTAMNGSQIDPRFNELIRCYGQKNDVGTVDGPTSTDITRARDYWSRGRERFPELSRTGTNTLVTNYQDHAWTEIVHKLYLYYWDGTQWVLAKIEDSIGRTGIHHLTHERGMPHFWDITALPRDTDYISCGRPIFNAFPFDASHWECSNILTVNSP